jgi:hypothetical protein
MHMTDKTATDRRPVRKLIRMEFSIKYLRGFSVSGGAQPLITNALFSFDFRSPPQTFLREKGADVAWESK